MPARTAFFTAVLWGGLTVLPAHGQEGTVRFAFQGSTIQVEVNTRGAAGSVEVVDGVAAAVAVTDRGGSGGAYVRLADGVLSLDNLSGMWADYYVVVPSGARVSLSIDDRTVVAVAPAGGGRHLSWRWEGEAAASRPPALAPAPAERAWRPRHDLTVNAFTGHLIVDSADVQNLDRVRALKIIVGGRSFRVAGNRSVRFGYDEEIRWGVVAPRSDGVEVTLELPADIQVFKLRVGGAAIWEVKDGRGRAHCEPVAEIEAQDGRLIWVFTPEEGRLRCSGKKGPRLAVRGPIPELPVTF